VIRVGLDIVGEKESVAALLTAFSTFDSPIPPAAPLMLPKEGRKSSVGGLYRQRFFNLHDDGLGHFIVRWGDVS
jgi:hypothetical protein